MIKFNEASLEELSKKFPQIPNRRLMMQNGLEDIQAAKEIMNEIRKERQSMLEQSKASKR